MSHEKAQEAFYATVTVTKEGSILNLDAGVSAYLSALVPDEVAGVAEELLRSLVLRETSEADKEAVRKAVDTLTALAARAEKAERELEVAWNARHAWFKATGEANARANILESELSALRAENDRLKAINANLMGDDEDKPRYTTKRLRHEIEQARAADAAELSALRARLDEAGKVIEPFAAIYERCIPEEPELRGPILNAKPDEKALVFPLVHDLRAARRFLEEAK
jgi:chromosome segregation ATPase